jgi:murein DD-endopeptidase MepM/ murein hydrolase activator NlpD
MGVAPNTMAAVTQRIGADTYAGLSGMSSRQAIMKANSQVGGGATSAMGPTMAAMNLMYQGGYTANSKSSQNIMGQIAGMSAMSGMSNEMAASSMASMNGMSFLRAGVQIRDSKGNLKPPNTIINDVYRFLYQGRKITKDQAALVMNPGSKGYATLQTITGGDAQLMQMIQSGIMARASAGSDKNFSSSMGSKDPNKMLNVLGVDQSSPLRANFRFNSSENKKLAATEQGLVGGYDASLRTTAALNDAYSKMADALGPVNDGLMTLKGILQTLPNAGNMGGVIAQFTGALAGAASTLIQFALLSKLLGGGGVAGLLSKGTGLASGLAAGATVVGAGLGAGAVGYGVGKGGKALGKKVGASKGVTRGGSTLAAAGAGAATGAAIGAMFAPETLGLSIVAGSIIGGLAGFFGSGGPNDHGNLGVGGPNDSGTSAFLYPVPKATPITSPFGPRDNSAHPGISSNHKGIDFGTPVGSNLTAVTDGSVSYIGNDMKGYGNWVEVQHDDGTKSRYGHLSQVSVSRKQKLKAGETVGRSGGKAGAPGAGNSTGPHLHFEILNEKGVKVNPAPYLSNSPASPINGSASTSAGPQLSTSWMTAAKSTSKGHAKGKKLTAASSPSLSSTFSSASFNEDLGGPSAGMNVGAASSSNNSKAVVINLKMSVNIAQGSVQEADRLVNLIGKKLKESDVLKQIGSAL